MEINWEATYRDKMLQLQEKNRILTEALEKMCRWHEKQATWDKGDNGYYEAMAIISKQINTNH